MLLDQHMVANVNESTACQLLNNSSTDAAAYEVVEPSASNVYDSLLLAESSSKQGSV